MASCLYVNSDVILHASKCRDKLRVFQANRTYDCIKSILCRQQHHDAQATVIYMQGIIVCGQILQSKQTKGDQMIGANKSTYKVQTVQRGVSTNNAQV